MDQKTRQWRNAFLIMAAIALLAIGYTAIAFTPNTHAVEEVRLETKKDFFVDIDGDGDLDYVHYAQFISHKQVAEEADPYPAPQPGQ